MSISTFLINYYVIFFIIAAFAAITWKKANNKTTKSLAQIILSVFIITLVLTCVDYIESFASTDPNLKTLRLIMSFLGYVLRPLPIFLLIYTIRRFSKINFTLLSIPAILNILVMQTCFYSPIAFSFDSGYSFVRGPLGYVVFIVCAFYLAYLLWEVYKKYLVGKTSEGSILIVCTLFIIGAVALDTFEHGCNTLFAIVISCVFYYLFLNSQFSGIDILTSTYNRETFYADCRHKEETIFAMASLDMNGLKVLNDTQGHLAGDKALQKIGEVLNAHAGKTVTNYRTGGDEFVVIYRIDNEDFIKKELEQIKYTLAQSDISVAVGYAFKNGNETVDDLYKISDNNMYKDKEEHYKTLQEE